MQTHPITLPELALAAMTRGRMDPARRGRGHDGPHPALVSDQERFQRLTGVRWTPASWKPDSELGKTSRLKFGAAAPVCGSCARRCDRTPGGHSAMGFSSLCRSRAR